MEGGLGTAGEAAKPHLRINCGRPGRRGRASRTTRRPKTRRLLPAPGWMASHSTVKGGRQHSGTSGLQRTRSPTPTRCSTPGDLLACASGDRIFLLAATRRSPQRSQTMIAGGFSPSAELERRSVCRAADRSEAPPTIDEPKYHARPDAFDCSAGSGTLNPGCGRWRQIAGDPRRYRAASSRIPHLPDFCTVKWYQRLGRSAHGREIKSGDPAAIADP